MNKERLQEIKDSIDLQLTLAKSVGARDKIAEEEQELYDEVIRLNNVINELEKYIKSLYIPGHTIQNASLDSIIFKLKKLKENK